MKLYARSFLLFGIVLTVPGAVIASEFHYHGDITAAVRQLARKERLTALPPTGDIRPITVDVDMDSSNITAILRSIGEQAGNKADVVYNARQRTVKIDFKDNPLPFTKDPLKSDALFEARKWQRGQAISPITGQDGLILFPYGQSQPTLMCSPLHACDIELQAGEDINNVIFGDTVRWISAPATTGTSASKVPHVIVKPTETGLETNLIITTTKRTYLITLKSANDNYTSRVGFFYPTELVQTWNDTTTKPDDPSKVDDMPMVTTDQLSFDYDVDGDKDVPWYPVRVFSDQSHVYIQMPQSMQSHEAPALVLIDTSGKSALVNYRVRGSYYIVDKLFQQAALIVGVGSDQQKVEITRKGHGLFSWLSR
jgi:P-type conjugative transfer protein TrbG